MALFAPREGAGRALWNALSKHHRSVGLLIDQNAPPGRGGGGAFVQFFGLPVPAPLGPARLAHNCGAPLVANFCVPDAGGRYRVFARTPDFASDQPDSGSDTTFVTQRLMNLVENEIRARPELWTWTYRRWDYIPFGEVSFSKYPFYAQKVVIPRDLMPRSNLGQRTTNRSDDAEVETKVA